MSWGPLKRSCVRDLEYSQQVSNLLGQSVHDEIHILKWFENRGFHYGSGVVILHDYEELLLPTFVEIIYIIAENGDANNFTLICKKWRTQGFDNHMWSWWVTNDSFKLIVKNFNETIPAHPIHIYMSSSGKNYILFSDT